MNPATIALAIAIALSLFYFSISIKAFAHVKESERRKKTYLLFTTDIWWPFYEESFDDSGKKFCLYGKITFPFMILAYVVWAFLYYG